ncbi:MAG: hypothetical protein ABH828_02630 [archaeon]
MHKTSLLIMLWLFYLITVVPQSVAFEEITINLTVSIVEENAAEPFIGNVIYESESEINKKTLPFFIAGVFFIFLVILIWKKL